MYLTIRQQIKHLSKRDYRIIKYLCHIAKNLANQAIYNVRQYYFTQKKYLNYYQNWNILKHSENYRKLQTHIAEQVIQQVDRMFKSFLGLLKTKKAGKYLSSVGLPYYLPKDGFMELTIVDFNLKDCILTISYSCSFKSTHQSIKINVPTILEGKKVKIIRIMPKLKARYFEVQYVYEGKETQSELDKNEALAIDLGVNNLAHVQQRKARRLSYRSLRL